MTITLTALQKQRRDTAANWTAENPTLLAGEIGIESDTGKIKIGTGAAAWNSLAYQGIIPSSGAYPLSQLIMPLGTAAAPAVTFTGDVNTGIYSPGADQVAISTGGSGQLFVDSNGRTGLGIATPDAKLHCVGQSTFTGSLLVNAAARASTGSSAFIRANNGFSSATTPDYSFWFDDDCGVFHPGADTLALTTNGSERLRITSTGTVNIVGAGSAGSTQAVSFNGSAPVNSLVVDSSGRVGIGTSAPNTKTHLYDASNVALKIESGGANYVETNFINTSAAYTLGIRPDTSNSLCIRDNTATATRVVLDSSGRVGIGTTSPSTTLHVSGGAFRIDGAQQARFYNTTSTELAYIAADAVSNTNPALLFGTGNSERARIDSSGTFRVKGAGTAGVNDAFAVNGSAPANSAQIDSSGRLLVGTSSARSNVIGSTGNFQLEQVNGCIQTLVNNQASGNDAQILFGKTRGTSVGSNTVVNDGDALGLIAFGGADGTNIIQAAHIRGYVDGTPGANSMPGRIVFSTATNASPSVMTERMRITSTGQLRLAGAGITFNGDTATANELDDYEEGDWTPALSFGGGTTGITYGSFTSGRYTKIGRLVVLHGVLLLTNKGSSTGNVLLTGFPFASANVNPNYAAISIQGSAGVTYSGTLSGGVVGGQSYARIAGYSGAGTVSYLNDTNFSNSSEILFSISYTV